MGVEDDSINGAARWSRRYFPRPWRFTDLVTAVTVSPSVYGRAITRWTSRVPVWRSVPHQGRKRVQKPTLDLADVDPWTVDERQLTNDSWHIATCATCNGSKKIQCATCHGTSRVRCDACAGTGRVVSSSAKNHNMVNCKRCRGSGQRRCPVCRQGQVTCAQCDGKAKLECWMQIETQQHTHVGIWPSGLHQQAHPSLDLDSEDADRWEGAEALNRTDADGFVPDDGPGPAATELNWSSARVVVEPNLNSRTDRVTYQSVRCYRAPVTTVHFSFSGHEGSLKLFGSTAIPTTECDAKPFTSYRRWLMATVTLAFAIVGAGAWWYAARDPFFGQTSGAFALTAAVVGLGLLLLVAGWRRRTGPRPQPLRRGAVHYAGATLALVGALCGALVIGLVRPDAEAASSAIAAGDFPEAHRHLAAIDRLGGDDPTAGWIAYYLAQADGASSDETALQYLPSTSARFGDDPKIRDARRIARSRLFATALAAGDRNLTARRLTALRGEYEGTEDEVDPEIESRLIAAATQRLEAGAPEQAERLLLLGWHWYGEHPEFAALGEQSVLAQADQAKALSHQIALLRRAQKLEVSEQPAARLEHVYTQELTRLGETEPADGDLDQRIESLTKLRDGYQRLKGWFPNHAQDVTPHLEPIEHDLERLSAKRRAEQERARAKEERKRRAAERREQRLRRKAKSSKPAHRTCCKYCSKGKPCGDTCIARNKTCHKGRGCAC